MRAILEKLEESLMALLLAVMTCLTFVQVVLRYLFNTGLLWSLEATTYCFAWLVLIGMSYGVRTRTHIAVNLATRRMPSSLKRAVALFAAGLCLLYAGLMLYGSFVFTERLFILGHDARDLPLQRWLLAGIMPVAFALLIFRFIQVAVQLLKGHKIDKDFAEGDGTGTLLDDVDEDTDR